MTKTHLPRRKLKLPQDFDVLPGPSFSNSFSTRGLTAGGQPDAAGGLRSAWEGWRGLRWHGAGLVAGPAPGVGKHLSCLGNELPLVTPRMQGEL